MLRLTFDGYQKAPSLNKFKRINSAVPTKPKVPHSPAYSGSMSTTNIEINLQRRAESTSGAKVKVPSAQPLPVTLHVRKASSPYSAYKVSRIRVDDLFLKSTLSWFLVSALIQTPLSFFSSTYK